MQREEKQLEAALEALVQRINDLKTSIRTLIFRLENEYATLSWPSVLDSYAVISGQVSFYFCTILNSFDSFLFEI